MFKLYPHQEKAVEALRSGSILCGGTGSGKSVTALEYYKRNEVDKPLYIITTAKKRDSLEWLEDCAHFRMHPDLSPLIIDSWNNIKKYENVQNAFFIFDEQRIVGSGSWVKSFIKMARTNNWLLLSATPGDSWSDYIPVFIANGFYKNRTEFIRKHVVYNQFTKYPKIDRYVDCSVLIKYRKQLLIRMDFERKTKQHHEYIDIGFNEKAYDEVFKNRWNIFEDRPVKQVSEWYYTMRRVVNSSEDRLVEVLDILERRKKVIIFYNFDYERELLLNLANNHAIDIAELNGHKHQEIPNTERWIYIVQYQAGAEAWNCVETDTIIFFSQSYSYKMTKQAAGRIDRLNTPFTNLYYYHFKSKSYVDQAIYKCLGNKKDFNEKNDSRAIHGL